jgi:hypothetical protein
VMLCVLGIVQVLKASKAAPRIAMGEQEHTGTSHRLLSGLDAIRPQGSLCVSTTGRVGVFASVAPNGRGVRVITGSTDPSFLDAAQVAISWVSLHAGWLRARGVALCEGGTVQRKGPGSRSGLQGPVEDVAVSFMDPHLVTKRGASAGACVALALVQWLWRPLTTRGLVSVTGPINLRGYLLPAEGIKEKAVQAKAAKADMLIMSDGTYDKVGVCGGREGGGGGRHSRCASLEGRHERASLQ